MNRLLKRAAIFLAPIVLNKVIEKFSNKDSKKSNQDLTGSYPVKKSKRKK